MLGGQLLQSNSIQMKNVCKNRIVYFIDICIYIVLSESDSVCDGQGNIKDPGPHGVIQTK